MPNRVQPAGVRRQTTTAGRTAPEGLPEQSEADFQRQVLKLAALCGWRAYHTWTSIHSAAGFPDLVLVRQPRVLFVELKRQSGKVSDAQQQWLDELAACGQSVYVWRPSDWDEVVSVLGAR